MAEQRNLMLFGGYLRRRLLLTASFGTAISLFPRFGIGAPLIGVEALDTPATLVKNPSANFLIAITRAGNRLVAVGGHGVIIYSDDNGITWLQASVPVSVSLTCVGFSSPMQGWAGGHSGVILNTADGGKTWKIQLTGIQANQLTLAAAQAAVAQNNVSLGEPLAMTRAEAFVQGGPDRPFLSLLCLSPQKVIVFGAYRMTMMTMDGGKTWEDWSLHIGDRLSHNLYAATVLGTDIYVAGEAGLVFCSTDGGNMFPQVASPSGVTLFGIVGAADGSIIVFGVAGNSFRSTDGGKEWVAISLGTKDNLTAGRALTSGRIIIASEAGALFVSEDNGATFQSLTGVSPISVYDFEQAADTSLIFIGNSGVTRVPLTILNN
jgi:photosystem II stability/assembly factor-like uncharacterized protein